MTSKINSDKAPKAIGPYSQAVVCGSLVFASGQLPIDPDTGTTASDIRSQAAQCLKNLKAVLEAAGADINSVLKTTVFLRSLNDFAVMNEEYAAYFSDARPARSTVEVSRLPKEALIEIDAIATLVSASTTSP
jgi:2-iminobutanoate/2-iminopropanoate deaminase